MKSACTGWRRLIGSPKLQIIFHKRATKYRTLLRKITYKDKGSYESLPPCREVHTWKAHVWEEHIWGGETVHIIFSFVHSSCAHLCWLTCTLVLQHKLGRNCCLTCILVLQHKLRPSLCCNTRVNISHTRMQIYRGRALTKQTLKVWFHAKSHDFIFHTK